MSTTAVFARKGDFKEFLYILPYSVNQHGFICSCGAVFAAGWQSIQKEKWEFCEL